MPDYNNQEGIITKIESDSIFINDRQYFAKEPKAKTIISASQAGIGDDVIFNFHFATHEIIFLRMKHPYYRGTEKRSRSTGPYGYTEDPRDPDEVHDMEAVYGHGFEGM
jgi:hypothetical protein